MRVVDKPVTRPMRCAAIPHIGQTHPTARWVDCGEMPGFDNRVYLSDIAVIEACRALGLPTPDTTEHLAAQVAALEARVAELEADNERLESENHRLDAVIGGIDAIESADFRARRKSGRRPAKTETETEKAAA